MEERLVRLGAWVPFPRLPQEFAAFTGVTVGRETGRRRTEAAGAALVAVETAAAERLEREGAPLPDGPAVQQVSVDGAMIPLVHGAWAEAKTLAVGTVAREGGPDGPGTVHTTELSYFSRLAEAEVFRRLARVETHRRGTATAGVVCGVVDGAPWCQHFLDWHCPQAVRILDFAHAAEYVSAAAQAVLGGGTAATSAWLGKYLHLLKHGDPERVLTALRALPAARTAQPAEATARRDEAVSYLEARRAQIAYAAFQAAGYPIGSGAVESANKLVVEVRLKGSGMHWARPNVNPMLALRGAVCSARWEEAWAQLGQEQLRQRAERRRARRAKRSPPAPAAPASPRAKAAPARRRRAAVARLPLGRIAQGRPTAAHPWRRPFLRRRCDEPTAAKT